MAFSYSFHLSGKGHSVSTVGKVGQVSRHNLREYESAEYDRNKIEVLRGSDSVLDDVKQIYHQEFDQALERYNQGKRQDRQIRDYLQHVSDSRADVACEIIVQVGDKDFWEGKSLEERKQMSYIFQDQLRSLEKLVPELKIASAVVHYDESSPHMHVVGVPVAEGYKKGLEKQVAKTKVFTADRLSYLQDRMRENAEKGMRLPKNENLFAEMELKDKEKGRNKDIPKSSMSKYHDILTEIEKSEKELTDKKKKIEEAEKSLEATQAMDALYGEWLKGTERKMEEAEKAVKSLQETRDALQGDVDALKAEKAHIGLETGLLENKKKALQDEVKGLESKRESAEDQIEQMGIALSSFEAQWAGKVRALFLESERKFFAAVDHLIRIGERKQVAQVMANAERNEHHKAEEELPSEIAEPIKSMISEEADHVEVRLQEIDEEYVSIRRRR